jgi:hypothetical protein
MPENEPEKNLKIQLPFRHSPSAPPSRSWRSLRLKTFKPSAIQTFSTCCLQKPSAILTVPLCSVLFRQKIFLRQTIFSASPPYELSVSP